MIKNIIEHNIINIVSYILVAIGGHLMQQFLQKWLQMEVLMIVRVNLL